jgi:hypothetical protein
MEEEVNAKMSIMVCDISMVMAVTKKKVHNSTTGGIDVNELPMHLYRYDKWRDT